MSRIGSGFRQLTPFDGAINESADWSPDGAILAYDRYGEGTQQVMIIKPDGTDARRITAGPLMHSYARWSPLAHPGAPSFPASRSADVSVTPRASSSRVARTSEAKTYPLLGNSKCTVTIRGTDTQLACTR